MPKSIEQKQGGFVSKIEQKKLVKNEQQKREIFIDPIETGALE